MVITDRYDHVIDGKGRLAIPSQFRNAMDPEEDGAGFYAVPEGIYLQLIPEKLFKRLAGQFPAGLSPSRDVAEARRLVFGTASYLEPDKQGRVIIPDRFLADSKSRDTFSEAVLGRKVTLLGASDRIELWNTDDLQVHMRMLYANRGTVQGAAQHNLNAPANVPAAQVSNGPSGV
jgi:division/cell wall cluster transcriptional repressor MraZ